MTQIMTQAAQHRAIRRIQGSVLASGLISVGMLVTHAQAAFYADPYFTGNLDLSVGVEAMSGDLTSSIGGEINYADGQTERTFFPISELEWPMDILLARFDGSLTLNPMWRINGTLKTAVDDPGETMIDRDQYAADGPADIYSESSISQFDAFILDVDFEWTYLRLGPWSLFTGVGYLYQDFEYQGNLLMQYSPAGIAGYNYVGNGSAGVAYENTFSMLYFLLGADVQVTPQFDLAGKFSVAPVTSSEDELHHFYYNKMSAGDLDGTAYMFEVSGNFRISPWWFVKAGVQYTAISVDGDQYQFLDGAPLGRIDQEVESDQSSAYITTGYSF